MGSNTIYFTTRQGLLCSQHKPHKIPVIMAWVLSNTATSATTPEQKDQLPNPFELQDSQIRHKVYLTHVNDDKEFDRDILFTLVSNTVNSTSAQLSAATVITIYIFIYTIFIHI